MSPARAVGWLIVAGLAIRLPLAAATGLGIDESYMVAAGRTPRLGYFDHPPLAWWLSSGIAHLTGSEADWVVRLPFIALFAASTWLMFRLASELSGPGAGLLAAVAFNLSPVFGVTTGDWVLPDGPLDCALLAAALCLVRALEGRGARWWLGAGLAAGCALLSKYSAGLVLFGALVYLLTQPGHRHWLRRPQPYVAVALAALLLSPVVLWNARHGWISFAFQGGRGAVERLRPLGPLTVLGGEALFVLPWLWLPMMAGFVRGLRAGPAAWRSWLPCCLGAPPIILFAVIGLWSRHVLYHWAAPGYLLLFPLLGGELERLSIRWPRAVPRVLAGTAVVLCLALGGLAAEVNWNWLPLGPHAFAPGADPAQQAIDWTALPAALAARGLPGPNAVIAAPGWQDAGKVGYALGPDVTVLCLNPDSRQFGFGPHPATFDGRDVLMVTSKPVTLASLAANGFRFDSLEDLAPVSLGHPARPGQRVLLYLGHRMRAPAG
jgi:4-amino-4-deoxy-L-arabinose transferase-like glycosyltransferase